METNEIITKPENKTVTKAIVAAPVIMLIAAAYDLIRRAMDKGYHVEAGYKDGYLKIDPN